MQLLKCTNTSTFKKKIPFAIRSHAVLQMIIERTMKEDLEDVNEAKGTS